MSTRLDIGLHCLKKILATQADDREWVIEGAGRAKYVFRLQKVSRILPNENLLAIKIPDATPEIIETYALSDEQALLAKVRYNRLVDGSKISKRDLARYSA